VIDYEAFAESLYRALFNYLHALHPASQRECAERARDILARYERATGK